MHDCCWPTFTPLPSQPWRLKIMGVYLTSHRQSRAFVRPENWAFSDCALASSTDVVCILSKSAASLFTRIWPSKSESHFQEIKTKTEHVLWGLRGAADWIAVWIFHGATLVLHLSSACVCSTCSRSDLHCHGRAPGSILSSPYLCVRKSAAVAAFSH